MNRESEYYVVRTKALPEILRKVAEVNKELEFNRGLSIQEATEKAGISRSSFYKYKDDIFPFYENAKGKTITLVVQMVDELGFLSRICSKVAGYKANILTIHQAIPVNGIATLTLSIEIGLETDDISSMIEEIENMDNVQYVKILAQENTP